MRFFQLSSSDFAVLTALGVSMTLFQQAYGAEKYSAQIEDGTPKSIAAKASAEDLTEHRVGSAARKTVRLAPKQALSPELVQLKRQNEEMKRRLEALEEERAAQRAESAQEAADLALGTEAPADETDKVARQRDVAPGAALADDESAKLPELVEEAPVAVKKPVVKKAAPAPVAAPAPMATVSALQKPAATAKKFDKVPDHRVAELAERLKYANDILKRYGRAYDYRITTMKELKAALADLEKAEEQQ